MFHHDHRANDISVSAVLSCTHAIITLTTQLITTSLIIRSCMGDWIFSLQCAFPLDCVMSASPWSRSASWRDNVHDEGPSWYDSDDEDTDQSKCRELFTPEEAGEEFVRAL